LSVTVGSNLGLYEITALMGKGGMGEVYRARDKKLKRDVAIKILPDEFSRDAGRVSRFQREAEVLASLNHPNIAAIYDIQESEGSCFLVLELVEGETLAKRIARGPIPIDEALLIAKQICEAVEAAHEKGIIHRDLKPANVKVLPDGKVKVLDFGLAKAIEPQTDGSDLSNSPTLLSAGQTQANVLLGTLPYMAPEQLRGRAADNQSDIWAFGCVLYEMLTGRQPFRGETFTDLSAEIVRIEPDWNALPAGTPATVRSVVKHCLQKDCRRRFHAIVDVLIGLEEEQKVAVVAAVPKGRQRLAWGIAGIFALFSISVLIAGIYFYPKTAPPHGSRFLIEIPLDANIGPSLVAPYPSVSPDGRYVAFVADSGTGARLWLRPVDSLSAQPLPGTELLTGFGVGYAYYFWSPDSRFIGFFANGKLKKIAAAGGPPQSLCDVGSGETLSGTWNQNDVILFQQQGSLHRVGAVGGVSMPVRKPDKAKNEVSYRWPSFLPDGQHFVYLAVNSEQGRSEVRVGALDSSDDRPLFNANSRVLYAEPGYLLFVRDGTLMAQPFDARRLSLSGDIFPVAEQVRYLPFNGNAAFSVSTSGTLVFQKGNAVETDFTWFDRSGRKLGSIPQGPFAQANLSPDQNRIAVERRDSGQSDIWLIDLLRGTNSRFTFDPGNDVYPVFSPDGKQIAFISNRSGKNDLYIKAASGLGAEERIQEGMDGVSDWSPDGKFLLPAKSVGGNWDIWVLPLAGDRKPYPLLNQKFTEYRGKFSPDGHWLLYTSDETGRNEIYVQAFPPSGGKWQVSVNGGESAYWRHDGKEIAFVTSDRKIMAADVKLGTTFEAGVPHELFQFPGTRVSNRIVMTSDAQRFLLPLVAQSGDRPAITVVLNWAADVKK
jgi:Tol biopolymer transport system component/tRNA A-37 threonylcarbamoyl transferase component Bud32